ncbi:MAG: hypothetical protein IPH82_29910 [Chloroflexi bacterium]|nr:hypothetical protein [Chloroflexota bacterium]
MRIDELSDEQKTAMLAELANMTPDVMNSGVLCVDLYDPANMALAWRVLNWAAAHGITTQINVVYQYKKGDWARMIDLPPADAQRAWLDYILSLAIEAGMVADDE